MTTIVRMKLENVGQRVERKIAIRLICDNALIGEPVRACQLPGSGACNIDSLPDQRILSVLSRELTVRASRVSAINAIWLWYFDGSGIAVDFEENVAIESAL